MSELENDTAAESQPQDQGRSLGSVMRAGVIYWAGGNFVARVIKLAVHITLAWKLDEGDYGLVAMTDAILTLLRMFSEFGTVPAIIQKKDMSKGYASTAFWVNSGMSVVMVCLAWVLAPRLAAFYNNEHVTLVVRVSSLGFFIMALRIIPMALLRKQLQFGRYAFLDSSWHIASGLLALVFAFAGARYWSLVIPQMIVGLLMAPLWFVASKWRPSFLFDKKEFAEIFAFSKNVVVVSLATFTLSHAGFIIAGHFLGADQAGIYKFAMMNAMFITFNFGWLVANVATSGFALAKGNDERLRQGFGRVYDSLLASAIPLHVLLFVQAGLVFQSVFPEKWVPALHLFRILLICGAVRTMTGPITQFYYAVNRSHVNVWLTAVQVSLLLPAMYFGCVYEGLDGLAIGTVVVSSTLGIAMYAITPYINRWESMHYVRRSLPWLTGSAVLAATAYFSSRFFSGIGMWPRANLVLSSSLALLLYPVVVVLLSRERFESVVKDIVPGRIRQKLPRFFLRETSLD